jgi:hypothetical protein
VSKAARAEVQLLKQKSSAYKIKEEIAQRTRLQGKLAREHCSA